MAGEPDATEVGEVDMVIVVLLIFGWVEIDEKLAALEQAAPVSALYPDVELQPIGGVLGGGDIGGGKVGGGGLTGGGITGHGRLVSALNISPGAQLVSGGGGGGVKELPDLIK